MALTTTCGGVMSGNCDTGSRKKQIEPASTMITAIADEKIGRWVKNPTIVQNAPRHCERMRDPETQSRAVSRYTPIGCKSWSNEARSYFALSALTEHAADPPADGQRPASSRATDPR